MGGGTRRLSFKQDFLWGLNRMLSKRMKWKTQTQLLTKFHLSTKMLSKRMKWKRKQLIFILHRGLPAGKSIANILTKHYTLLIKVQHCYLYLPGDGARYTAVRIIHR